MTVNLYESPLILLPSAKTSHAALSIAVQVVYSNIATVLFLKQVKRIEQDLPTECSNKTVLSFTLHLFCRNPVFAAILG